MLDLVIMIFTNNFHAAELPLGVRKIRQSIYILLLCNLLLGNNIGITIKPFLGYTIKRNFSSNSETNINDNRYIGIALRPHLHESYFIDFEINNLTVDDPEDIFHKESFVGMSILPGYRFNYNHPAEFKIGLGYSYLYSNEVGDMSDNSYFIFGIGTPIYILNVVFNIEYRFNLGISLYQLKPELNWSSTSRNYNSRLNTFIINFEI